jgi:type IV fimbrial biogenesis protein FimT
LWGEFRVTTQAAQQPGLQRTAQSGFSLTELMVTLSIGALLMAIGIPSYRYVTNSNRATTEINSLLGDMQFARSESIREGLPVTICPLTGSAGSYSCNASSNVWNSGWIVFLDVNGDGTVQTGETLLRVRQPFATTTDSLTSDNNLYLVTFNREGFATNVPSTANNFVTVTLHTNPVNNAWTRCLEIGTFGILRTVRPETAPSGTCQ